MERFRKSDEEAGIERRPADRRAEGGDRRDQELLRGKARRGGGVAPGAAANDGRSQRTRDARRGVPPRSRAAFIRAGGENRENPSRGVNLSRFRFPFPHGRTRRPGPQVVSSSSN